MKKQTTVKSMLAILAAALAFPAAAEDVPAVKEKAPAAQEAAKPAVKENAPAAQEAAKPAVNAPAAQEAAKPAVTLESVLSFLPDVLAEVGDVKITKEQLIKQLSMGQVAPEMLAQLPQEMVKGLLVQQIQEMVDQAVCLALAKKAGLEPSEKLVRDEMDKLYNSMGAAQKAELDKNLKANGKNYVDYRDEIAKNPEAQKYWACTSYLKSAVVDKERDSVTDDDAEKFYRENQVLFEMPVVTVSHILALVPDADEAGKPLTDEARAEKDKAAKAKIDGIYARLKQGERFEYLAEQESECPSGKQSKGRLPAFTEKGRMANGQMMEPTFTKASVSLTKVGEISDIVKTPFGYHIIRLEEKKPQEYVPFAKVKDEIRAQLAGEKIDKAVHAALEQGRKDLGVKIFVSAPDPRAVAVPAAPAAAPEPKAAE